MGFVYEERGSDSPFIETVMRGYTRGSGRTIRPAECHWHLVLVRLNGQTRMVASGPCMSAGELEYIEGVELLWIKLKLGAFMPHLPLRSLLDVEVTFPEVMSRSFWLHDESWEFPAYENAETFIHRLARREMLVRDPLVSAVLEDESYRAPDRTVRHRFLRSTGMAQTHIHQVARAQRAAALLRRGVPILETVHEAGYFDQSHLTRSLKQFIGHVPSQLLRMRDPE